MRKFCSGLAAGRNRRRGACAERSYGCAEGDRMRVAVLRIG